ncbi:MAG: hypothetical protein LUQ25_09240 [Methanoregulaceae archaeon]|nr:hypothetical protein [Methanoregulaceae archaeon]
MGFLVVLVAASGCLSSPPPVAPVPGNGTPVTGSAGGQPNGTEKTSPAGSGPIIPENQSDINFTARLFYNRNCHECMETITFLQRDYIPDHPTERVEYIDVFNNPENLRMFQEANEKFGRPLSKVPALVIGDRELVGFDEIRANLTPGRG